MVNFSPIPYYPIIPIPSAVFMEKRVLSSLSLVLRTIISYSTQCRSVSFRHVEIICSAGRHAQKMIFVPSVIIKMSRSTDTDRGGEATDHSMKWHCTVSGNTTKESSQRATRPLTKLEPPRATDGVEERTSARGSSP